MCRKRMVGSLLHGQSSMVKTLSLRIYKKDPSCGIATYERGRLRFWTDPFEINVSNEFHFFTPSDSVQDVTLFAKYTLRAMSDF